MVSLSTYTLQDGQLKLYSVSNYEYDVYGNYSMQETYYYSQDTVSLGSRLTYEYDNDRIQWQKSYIIYILKPNSKIKNYKIKI